MNDKQLDERISGDWPGLRENPEFWKLRDLLKKNLKKGAMLSQRGATLDEVSVTFQRLNRFIDKILPPDSAERLEFELEWQGFIAESLEKLHSAVNERDQAARLEQVKTGGLFIPGR